MMATIIPFKRPGQGNRMSQCTVSAVPVDSRDANGDSSVRWGEWMLLAQDGDRDAYQSLLLSIAPYLRAISRRYLGRGEDAEDAVQEILLIVHDIRHTYEAGRPFKPWLNTIASRRCIDLLRRRSRRLQNEITTEDDLGELATDGSPGPYEATARLHEAAMLHEQVAGLSPRQQEAVRLLRLSELSLKEAAAQSEQSIGSLKVACHRALKSLKQALVQKGRHHE